MSCRTLLTCLLFGAGLSTMIHANATQPMGLLAADALQIGASSNTARHELGAVVDVRQANRNGIAILAVTPGGAADRMGLRAGDRLLAINGRRLDDTPKPSFALEGALQESGGALQVEASRNGKPLVLSGRADAVRSTAASGNSMSCGYLSTQAGVIPRTQHIFRADITQIDGRSTPIEPAYRHRASTGKHVLVVREFIDSNYLNSAQLNQIAKMKKFAFARAYKSFVLEVKPNMSYRIGARLLKDKLDTQSIRDNAYWEPVIWEEVPETCT
jgi:membrane-associated protease RseP (regulator of RpoE activity)